MLYTIVFSKKVEGMRQPYTIDEKEASVTVEANGRVGAMEHVDTLKFCLEHGCRIRRVTP